MDAAEIREQLAARALEVCQLLLPGGKNKRRKYFAGSTQGGPGESLVVELDGSKRGCWKDFASGEPGGSLIGLWMECRGLTVADALKDIKEHFGWEDAIRLRRPAEKKFVRPDKAYVSKHRATRLRKMNPPFAYLVNERKIDWHILDLYRVMEQPERRWTDRLTGEQRGHGWRIGFPYLRRTTGLDDRGRAACELIDLKFLGLERDPAHPNRKDTYKVGDAEPCLYGWQAVGERATELIITEGENDAHSWAHWVLQWEWRDILNRVVKDLRKRGKPEDLDRASELEAYMLPSAELDHVPDDIWAMMLNQAGQRIGAVSVPLGSGAGGKLEWVEYEWERLQRFERIYLSFDVETDPAKREAVNSAVKELASRLGYHRCFRLEPPLGCKDANDGLKAGATHQIALAQLDLAERLTPGELKRPRDAGDKIVEMRRQRQHSNMLEPGFRPPWLPRDRRVVMAKSQMTIVYGYNGHGKSEFTRQMALEMAEQGERVLIIGLEEEWELQLDTMLQQVMCSESDDRDWLGAAMDWIDGRVWYYDKVGYEDLAKLVNVITFAVRCYGVTVVVLDSFMRINLDLKAFKGSLNDAQDDAMKQLIDFASSHMLHLVMVAHARKTESENKPPDKMDVSGAGGVTNNIHHLIRVWRNKKPRKDGKEHTQIAWVKNRRYGDEPMVKMYFDHGSRRFCLEGQTPRPIIQNPHASSSAEGEQEELFHRPASPGEASDYEEGGED